MHVGSPRFEFFTAEEFRLLSFLFLLLLQKNKVTLCYYSWPMCTLTKFKLILATNIVNFGVN
jgi:hypothetical protein